MGGFIIILSLIVICATIIAGMYLYYCATNRVKMFRNLDASLSYTLEMRIDKLTDEIKTLSAEIQEMRKQL